MESRRAPFLYTTITNMRLLVALSSLRAATLALAKEAPTELIIDTTFTPEDCSVKAQTGDSIQVHYVGTVSQATILRA